MDRFNEFVVNDGRSFKGFFLGKYLLETSLPDFFCLGDRSGVG